MSLLQVLVYLEKRSTYLEVIVPVLRRPSVCLDIEPVINWNDLFTILTVTLTLLL